MLDSVLCTNVERHRNAKVLSYQISKLSGSLRKLTGIRIP